MKKRNLFITGVVLLVIVLVSLLPVILSSGGVQDLLVSRVNTQIPGVLSVGSCSIGWQQGLQCRSLAYDETEHGVHISIPRLGSSQGLLALIVTPMNLGTVSVDEPVLVLPGSPPAVKQSPVTVKNNTPQISSPAATEKSSPTKESAPLWDRVIVNLLVNNGIVKLAFGKEPAEIFFRNGTLMQVLHPALFTLLWIWDRKTERERPQQVVLSTCLREKVPCLIPLSRR